MRWSSVLKRSATFLSPDDGGGVDHSDEGEHALGCARRGTDGSGDDFHGTSGLHPGGHATAPKPFFAISVNSFSEAPRGRFSPRSH